MSNKNSEHYFLKGGGEMGELIRAKDWSKTSLGDPAEWPQCLCTMVGVMLDNPFGMYIAWGSEYIQLYNDGYRPILGATKHPQALGISTRETFSEIWHIIDSMFDGVMKGKAVGFPDLMLPLNRNGFVEECYFDFSYSPIRNNEGEVGGVLVTVIETTNKKKSEDALKESELRFRALADNIPNLGWMADAEGWIYWYNKKWYEYTGTTPEQMEGWGWQSVHDPVELPKVLERWKESIATGNPFEMVFPLKGADGKFRHFLTRILPVKDDKGKILQWFGSNTDITTQKDIEDALKASEQRFRDTVKQAPVGITILRGRDYTVEMANDTYLRLVDRTVTEFIGRPLFDSLPEVEESVHALLDSVLNTGVPFHGNEVPIPINRYGKQEVFYFDFLYHPLKEQDGEISGIIVIVTEVSEKVKADKKIKENEKLLQSIFFTAPAAIALITGPEHTYVLANKEYQNMVNRNSEQLLGKASKTIFPELA
ncbi:MAG: PAS domain-containing protein, partial [Ferruginibacter sp.]